MVSSVHALAYVCSLKSPLYVSCFSTHEASILRNALSLKEYSPSIQMELVDILSGYGCRRTTQPSNLRNSIAEAARYTFLVKPAAALSMMNAGIPERQVILEGHVSGKAALSLFILVCLC